MNRPSQFRLALVLVTGAALIGAQAAQADQVIADDLIVQSSACVGIDCVNGENFGFATIRLKENNTRIDFVDTSVGSFPTRDWRLEANSSSSGGGNLFAIKDMGDSSTGAEGGTALLTLRAGAPANSIFLSSAGNVGFGTANPVLDLHILTNDTPAMRLDQSSGGGFPAQVWDIAGNEANFFVRDVTGGSRLPFRIRPGAPTSSLDISATGNVGFGTVSPQANIHVSSSGAPTIELETTGASAAKWTFSAVAATGNLFVTDLVSGNTPFKVAPGAPTNSLAIQSTGQLVFAALPNCTAGLRTNATGVVSCVPPPAPPPGGSAVVIGAAVSKAAASKFATIGGAGSLASGAAASSEGDEQGTNPEKSGCKDGDMAGAWSMTGTNIELAGAGSVTWCDVSFAKTTSPNKYSVSGTCRAHAINSATPQTFAVSGERSIAVTSSCSFSGNFKIKNGKSAVTATIMEGRIEGPGSVKTRALGVARLASGKSAALQTFVMQR